MVFRPRRLWVSSALALLFCISVGPASAGTSGACDVDFNGIAVDRIDRLRSPLELNAAGALVFNGTSEAGVTRVEVRLLLGPTTFEARSIEFDSPSNEFSIMIPLEEVSPIGVGLFRIVGEADGCRAEAWLRVSGRFPLATLVGLIGMGLALGGITGQLSAIAGRRRWVRSVAMTGGVATGIGLALVGQQLGRLQISYPSLIGLSAAAAAVGFGAAWLLNPALRAERRQVSREDRPDRLPGRSPDPNRVADPRGEIEPPEAAYWCFVTDPTAVFDLTDHTRSISTLEPGTWYLVRRHVDGWAHVVVSDGIEGWVPELAVYRRG